MVETFKDAYITCALWSSTDDKDQPLDSNFSVEDIAPETLTRIAEDCETFEQANAELLEQWYSECNESPERAGHDFWLTRNGHGAGFWDRWNSSTEQGKIGQRLTEAAHSFGSCDLYVGDDGKVYAG